MTSFIKTAVAMAAVAVVTQAGAQVTFYANDGFQGESFTTQRPVDNLTRYGFNDRASSVVVQRDRWEVCNDAQFGGQCAVLRPGRYPTLASTGLNDRISSARVLRSNVRVDDSRYAPAPRTPQVTFYENDGFGGRSFTTQGEVRNFQRAGFNDRASSVVVVGDRWEACEDVRYSGRCVILRPGRYASLSAMGLNDRVSSVREVGMNVRIDERRYAPMPVAAVAPQVIFYENDGFGGRTFTTEREVGDFQRFGFNDRASSVIVIGDRWEVCEDVRFTGRCVVLRPGRYASLSAMGLNDRVSSVREVAANVRVEDNRYAPPPVPVYDSRRRYEEQIYAANVTSVRAVVGPPQQRCWVEQQQVAQPASGYNVPAALAGAVLGGVLGHQVGGGRGKDLATAGGAVAGAAIGANVGGGGQQVATQNVQRCETVPSQAKPEFWDVTYTFRGVEHSVQTTAPPGPTVNVNERGEPRT
jgi:uncharacterized protein YcfJ